MGEKICLPRGRKPATSAAPSTARSHQRSAEPPQTSPHLRRGRAAGGASESLQRDKGPQQ